MLGIAATSFLGYILGLGEAPRAVVALPFKGEFSLGAIALKLNILGMLKLSLLPMLEPSDPAEAREMVLRAFELRSMSTPITTALASAPIRSSSDAK